ncbi:MAG: peptide chain release factor N(5)-glutamine methyltransferase [Gammaproteobacteria bacterium]
MDPTESLSAVLRAAVAELTPHSSSARLDAELLIGHVLGKNRAFLRAWPETRLGPVQIDTYRQLVAARKKGNPVAYLIGYREFWSGCYRVGPAVLIPRPETELLIEMALEVLPEGREVSILELGTGSGIIAVSLAMERSEASILATDVSPAALEIARHNASQHGVHNISFLNSDWFASVPMVRYDLIISNPPYIADHDPHLLEGDLVFEPEIALKSGPSGMEALSAIADQARHWLKPGGRLLLEHGYQQAGELQRLLHRFGYRTIATRHDFQHHPRATGALWPGDS